MSERRPIPMPGDDEISEAASDVKEALMSEPEDFGGVWTPPGGNFDFIVSTGSTLLDLAISGGVEKFGGIPGGIMVELYGSSGSGKTSIVSEICASVQLKGGEAMFRDPEGRLNQKYAEVYGLKLGSLDYSKPNTVEEVFKEIYTWEKKTKGVLDVYAVDSLAALSTEMEMEDGDAYGARRAKMFSEGLRKTARIISNSDRLVVFSNQLRDVIDAKAFQKKKDSPGGNAIKFYSSLRLELVQTGRLKKKVKVEGKDRDRVFGITTKVSVEKSTVDNPYRDCEIYIVFGHGIDDVRANLQFLKDYTKAKAYAEDFKEGSGIVAMQDACDFIELNALEMQLRERTAELWHKIEQLFRHDRKKKVRF